MSKRQITWLFLILAYFSGFLLRWLYQLTHRIRLAGNLNHLFKELSWFYAVFQGTVFRYMVIVTHDLSHDATTSTHVLNILLWGDHALLIPLSASGRLLSHRNLFHDTSSPQGQTETSLSVLPCASLCCHVPQAHPTPHSSTPSHLFPQVTSLLEWSLGWTSVGDNCLKKLPKRFYFTRYVSFMCDSYFSDG